MKLEIGIGVLSLLFVVGGHTAIGAERTETRPLKQAAESRNANESTHGLLVQELETLPDAVTIQLTEEAYPEVYRFFRGRIAAKDKATVPSPKTAGCCGAGASLRAVPTTGGILGILDKGDGVVHVLAYAIDHKDPDLTETDGLALSAIITRDGVEVLSMDMDRLSRFVGGNQSGTAEGDGGVANVGEGGGDTRLCPKTRFLGTLKPMSW